MTQLEVEIALERYRNEIESLKHRMDEVQRSVDAVHLSLIHIYIYQAEEDEELWAAGFYATDEDTQYEVYVVNNAAGSADFGRRRSVARGKLEHAGYYTIDFPKPAAVKAGERFAVIVSKMCIRDRIWISWR